MSNSHQTLSLNPRILSPAGCTNQNEISTSASRPRPVPDAPWHRYSLFNDPADPASRFCVEFLLMGRVCGGPGAWHDRRGHDGEHAPRIEPHFASMHGG
jgi:hypothetical protein